LVFDAQGRVMVETLQATQYRDPTWKTISPVVEDGAALARRMAAEAQPAASRARTLFGNHGGYNVFGHLMCETIPLALVFSKWLHRGEMRLLMPPARSTKMQDGLLDLAGFPATIQMRSREPFIWVQGLIVSSTCSAQATFAPGPLHFDFARTIKATVRHRKGTRRLFLTRSGERTTQRRDLVNEEALIAALAPLGFEAVNPGLLQPRQQVALFTEAECLVSLMGSVWANLMYAEPGTLVVDLLPEHKAAVGDRFGVNMAKAMSLPYILILTKSEGPDAGHLDVTADVPLVVDRVRRGLERLAALRMPTTS
jgi:capsular polysaccharide biosynthesis protein